MAAGLFNSVIHCIGARRGGDEPGQGDLFKLLSILRVFAAMILFYLSERGLGGGCEPGQGKCKCNFFKLLSKRVFEPIILLSL